MPPEISNNDQMQQIANFGPSEIVYGYDDSGNQVILGVILKGSAEDNDDDYLNKVMEESNEDGNDLEWVAVQEECVSTNDVTVESNDEKYVDVGVNDVIKVYQVNKAERKILKKLKMDVRVQREKRKNKKASCEVPKRKIENTKRKKMTRNNRSKKVLKEHVFPKKRCERNEEIQGTYHISGLISIRFFLLDCKS